MIFTKSSIDRLYCMALRARTNSGLPSGSQPSNWVIVVSVISIPAEVTPKSSSLAITPGRPSMRMREPDVGLDVEDDIPARADDVVGPGVVPHDDPSVPRVAARGDEGAAVAGRVRCRRLPFLPVEPGNVVVGKLLVGVQGDEVPSVGVDPLGLRPATIPSISRRYSSSILGQSIFSAAVGRRPSRAGWSFRERA